MEHLNLKRTIQLYCEALDHFYCKPTFDMDYLLKKASSFLAYNYFDDLHHAAEYFALKLYPFFHGQSIKEQQTIEQNPDNLEMIEQTS